MNGKASRSRAVIALGLINKSFSHRLPPAVLTDSVQLTDFEYAEVMSFQGMKWEDVSFAQLEQFSDAVFWFSPEAFCYYLPGILAAGPKEDRYDCNAYDSLIGFLDRSPEPDYWDEFFLPRWPRLTADEIDAVVAWVRWLESVMLDEFYGNTYARVRDTLALLKGMAQQPEAHY